MENHKYLKENGVEFGMSAQDIVSADVNEVFNAEIIRERNIGEGCR